MKVSVDVANRAEADAVRAAWQLPDVKALVLVMGALQQLPSDGIRRATLEYVDTLLKERNGAAVLPAVDS